MRSVCGLRPETLVSGGSEGFVLIWNSQCRRESKKIYGHSCGLCKVSIRQDGLQAASAAEDEQIQLWSARTGKTLGRRSVPILVEHVSFRAVQTVVVLHPVRLTRL